MNKAIRTISACLAVAGCAGGPSGPAAPSPGYADGSRSVDTPDLRLTSSAQAIISDGTGTITGLENRQITWRTTSDPNTIILEYGGTDITLTWDPIYAQFSDLTGQYQLTPVPGGKTADAQLIIMGTIIGTTVEGIVMPVVGGLQTNPAQMPGTGSASYAGVGGVSVLHGATLTGSTDALATTNLTADFAAGTISGTMALTESGNSTVGFEIPAGGTTLTLNPAAISGNAFSGNWTGNLADLHLSSLGTADYQGAFYGVSAADVGGTLSGQGISADGTTPAWITGVFMGQ